MRLLLAAGLALALLAGCSADTTGPGPGIATPPTGSTGPLAACPAAGSPATGDGTLPELSLGCLGGAGSVDLRRLTGTPTVLNLWASWCEPCRAELPAFVRLQRDAGTKVRVLGVATKDVPGVAVSYASDARLPFPSVVDRSGDLLRWLRRQGPPVTVLVRADGTVAKTYQGEPLTDATLRALVKDSLGVDV